MDDCNRGRTLFFPRPARVQIPLWTIVTYLKNGYAAEVNVQIPLWTIVTCISATCSRCSRVQIPLWTIVTPSRPGIGGSGKSSDSSMDDCNAREQIKVSRSVRSSDSSMDDCNAAPI
mgnify:CR=1 FL=1